MKILSWNVNGLRAIYRKEPDIETFFKQYDIICLTEVKLKEPLDILESYSYKYWNLGSSSRHGVAIFSKYEPRDVNFYADFTSASDRKTDFFKGRIIELDFEDFVLINVYVPNSGNKLYYRTNKWDPEFFGVLENKLSTHKKIIVCGDFNVVQDETDTSNFDKQRNKLPGVYDDERSNFDDLLKSGFINVYKYFHKEPKYTYYSYRTHGRRYNNGMTIDYFLCSHNTISDINSIKVLDYIELSDHVPLEIKL